MPEQIRKQPRVKRAEARFTAPGYINVDKPVGWTSADVVRKLKGLIRPKKIGHGGTLDPVASGVLPVCLNGATRFAEIVFQGEKEYALKIRMGEATDTFDSEGKIVSSSDWSSVTLEDAKKVAAQFVGEIEQLPPMYSAVKHKGKRLYELARQGIEVKRLPRTVFVGKIEIYSWDPPNLEVEVVCGKGFYARSFADDFGKKVGSDAHLAGLVRRRVGDFQIKDAHSIEHLEQLTLSGSLTSVILPIDFPLKDIQKITLDPIRAEMVANGRSVPAADSPSIKIGYGQKALAYTDDGAPLAILIYEPGRFCWRPERVLTKS